MQMFSEHEFQVICQKFLDSSKSIRQFCSEQIHISRSHFHRLIHTELPCINKRLYLEVCKKLNHNYRYRHRFTNNKQEDTKNV